jgi:predicted transcriptional regulator
MIYAEILGNIRSALQNGEKPTITRIQLKVNVPFVRFKEYWEDLKARGLINAESEISLTKEGERYLEEYHKVREFLKEFGFIKEEDEDEDDTENDKII